MRQVTSTGSLCWVHSLSKDGSNVREAVRAQKCLRKLLPCLTIQGLLDVSSLLLGKVALDGDKALTAETAAPETETQEAERQLEAGVEAT